MNDSERAFGDKKPFPLRTAQDLVPSVEGILLYHRHWSDECLLIFLIYHIYPEKDQP